MGLPRLAVLDRSLPGLMFYRLRGVTMRLLRAALVLNVLNRVWRAEPEQRLRRLEKTLAEKEQEIQMLRDEIDSLRNQIQRGQGE